MAERKAHILFVSDMHYTNVVGNDELAVSYVLGATQQERLAFLNQRICEEHAKQPLDAVLILGDYSVDDYPWRKETQGKENYCEKYQKEFLSKLPVPVYSVAGNHDSYPNEMWLEMTGNPRQFAVEIGGILFLMLETFRGLASSASGSPYCGVDVAWVKEQIAAANGKPVILCSHYFAMKRETEEFRTLLRETPEIVALFQGHSHIRSAVNLGEECGNKPLFDIGGFSYNCYHYTDTDGVEKWDFNHYDRISAWGYQLLSMKDFAFTTEYVYPEMTYRGNNGTFHVAEDHIVHTSADSLPTE